MSFAELEKLEDITVYLEDCTGLNISIITNGVKLNQLQKRADTVFRKDTAAAKLMYAELTKSCKKSQEELETMQNLAKIGVAKAKKEITSWFNDCLYWFVLRKVLHDAPIPVCIGRCGVPVGSGVKLPGKGVTAVY
jgi:hypothetical protein